MKRLKRIASFRRFDWPLGLYRVSGRSMHPVLSEGQLIVGWRWAGPKTGRVVVVQNGRPLVKRVAGVDGQQIWLLGDNPDASTDSRQFGYVQSQQVEAIIIWPRTNAAA